MFKLKCACDYCIDQEQIPNQFTRFTEIKKQTKKKKIQEHEPAAAKVVKHM